MNRVEMNRVEMNRVEMNRVEMTLRSSKDGRLYLPPWNAVPGP